MGYAALTEIGPNHWLQSVLQVRVRPASFEAHPGSLQNKHWPNKIRLDPNFKSLSGLEWVLEDPTNIIVTGVLFREMGSNADPMIYGETAAQVTHGMSGPEYEWTRLRAKAFEQQGLYLDS